MFHCIVFERQIQTSTPPGASAATHTMGAACVMQKYRASSNEFAKFLDVWESASCWSSIR